MRKEQLDTIAREAAKTADGAAFIEAGFSLFDNGGGATAWTLECADDWRVLVTNEFGDSHESAASWLVGLHSPEFEFDGDFIEAATVSDAIEAAKVRKLARAFASELESEIGAANMETVTRRNATPDYAGACASHDFCDANMTMERACLAAFGAGESDVATWNAAWDFAKRHGFFIFDKVTPMIQTFKDWSAAKVRRDDISALMGFNYPKAGLVYPGETVIEVEPGGYSLCIGNMTRTFPEYALSAAERDLYAFYLSECTDFPDILDSAATADTVCHALAPIMRVVGLTDTAYARAYCGSDEEWRAADKSRRVEILEGYVSAAIERES